MDEDKLRVSSFDNTVTTTDTVRDLVVVGYEAEFDFSYFHLLIKARPRVINLEAITSTSGLTRPAPTGIRYEVSVS